MPELVCSRWRWPSELSVFGLRPAPWHLGRTVHRLTPAPSGACDGAAGELGTASWTSTAVILILRGVTEQAPPAKLTPGQGSGQPAWLALEASLHGLEMAVSLTLPSSSLYTHLSLRPLSPLYKYTSCVECGPLLMTSS